MAVLEAFVYDPLINWRLMQADPETRPPDRTFLVIPTGISPVINPTAAQLNRDRKSSRESLGTPRARFVS